mmetsp:Transcript_55044/g.81682  ORF Transcript_55044/g.81682 Transcript_55044/m.81682 type:complete len:85 (-) Transcript_55044:560-814(-)
MFSKLGLFEMDSDQHDRINFFTEDDQETDNVGLNPPTTTRSYNSLKVKFLKGTLSDITSHKRMPKEYTSAFKLYGLQRATSGAM